MPWRRQMKEELGINVMAFSCEGYKGVSQSAGHHIANNGVFKNIIGLDDTPDEAEFNMNILGEYNIGGDAWEIDTLLRKCGIHVTATLSGDVSYDQVKKCHTVQLNGVMCHRSINYIAEMMEKKFGIPWIKVNFIGAEATAKTLRKIAKFFDSKKLTDRVEEVIAQEMLALRPVREEIKAKHQGKKAALFVGGSRAHHYQDLFRDIGMEIVSAGYEFAHRDDYEGRKVLPTIKVDADSRNIEELHVEADPERFKPTQDAGANGGAASRRIQLQGLRRHDGGDEEAARWSLTTSAITRWRSSSKSTSRTSSAPASRTSSSSKKWACRASSFTATTTAARMRRSAARSISIAKWTGCSRRKSGSSSPRRGRKIRSPPPRSRTPPRTEAKNETKAWRKGAAADAMPRTKPTINL